ncbi:ribosomal protein S5 domain 2-type protein [Cercophora newfieldiana]|uniref:Ribosomal RNA-processing protein 43 n=1 Tax=Cercophora newfieldiana TaxID=92897 RepID=A0AA39YR30_9PEZI|nr:ribosomal protein S5 domain 2-type protein [Cercophora newfieldiana]
MAQPTLTFPRPVFAKLSPHPFLLRSLCPQSESDPAGRTNGRAPREARSINIHTSSLSHAHGSAVIRTGDTTVICGVRAEVLPVASIPQFRPRAAFEEETETSKRAELKNYDLLVPNIELATGCAPQFLPGVPPTALAQTLSTRVYSLLHGSGMVDVEDLRIWKRQKKEGEMEVDEDGEEEREEQELVGYWVLYVDLLFVSFDGNPFDAAWTAVVAALKDTKLPVARWDTEREAVVCSRESRPLKVRGLPVACSAAVFLEKEYGEPGEGRHWILLDPDRLEETLCREVITMVVDCSSGETRIRAIEKQGGTVVGRELLRGFAGVAEQRWKEVSKAMQ